MTSVTIPIPDETLIALKMSSNEITYEIQMLVAVKLYEMKKISSGAAATFAGIPKPLFLSRLYLYGIDTFNLTKEELISDLNNA